ncbi:hypothetical protein FCM35_KLT18058 [Carex littledalei]|uniref:DUF674 domain-containing protein n=1 Tax=Carex littledalei TaxID=544730 RepID=A0A833RE33_9POAL|nr:hypothetical protein FCM35_KLT18058 [Carex littledalei]
MANAGNELTLKLLIDKKTNKVLFGEASKDVVDFIFSLLALPLGAVTKLLTKDAMVGSIGEVYHSLGKLNETYILSNDKVSSLVNPALASTSNTKPNFLLPQSTQEDTKDRTIYRCASSHYGSCGYVSEAYGVSCPNGHGSMNVVAKFVEPKPVASSVVGVGSEGKGYVKGVVTYSVMDDLTVVPMSTISSITLLNKFQIKDLGSLEEKTVSIGFEEGLKLLKASLETKTVLTDVFLKKNRGTNA